MKKVLFTLLCLFLFISCCNASVVTYDRNTLPNYGVNKKWKITDDNRNNVLSTHAVDASEKIYDFSDILTENEEIYLKELIDEFYEDTGFDLVILTESFMNYDDDDNGGYAQDFYDYNDFGIEDKYYSGVVILRNTYPDYPWYGVYSFGEAQYYYQTEHSYDRLNYTLDNVYSDFVSGNYKEGMSEIIKDLTYYYHEGMEDGMEHYSLDSDGMLVKDFNPPVIISFGIALIVTAIVIFILVKRNRMIYKERFAHQYLDKSSVVFTRKSDILYDSRTTSYSTASSSGGSSGGGRSYSSSRGSSGGGRSGGGRRG